MSIADRRTRWLSPYALGCLTIVLGGLILSLGVFFIRSADEADAFQYTFWRGIGLTMSLVIVASLRGEQNPWRQLRSMPLVGWIGGAAIAVSAITFILALKVSTFAETFFLCSLAPLMAVALARPLLGERWTAGTLAAIGTAVVGVYVMVGGDLAGGNWTGRTLALVSAAAFAGYTLATRSSGSGSLDALLIAFGIITVLLSTGALLVRGGPFLPSLADMAIGCCQGAVVLSLGLWLFGQGSRHVSAVTLTMLAQTEAVISPVWAALAFGERPGWAVIAGGSLILAAVVGQAADAARRHPSSVKGPVSRRCPADSQAQP